MADRECGVAARAWRFAGESLSGFPRAVRWYLYLLGAYVLFCVGFFPVTDSDALTCYVARFLYQRFGPLEEVATLSIQYTFPETFDRLIWLVARSGYAAAVPAFVCFLAILVCGLREVPPQRRFWVVILVLVSPVLLTQAMSQKNDVGMAGLAVLAVHLLTRQPRPWTVPAVLLCCGLLVGTKWSAVPLAMLILLGLAGVAIGRRWRILRRPSNDDFGPSSCCPLTPGPSPAGREGRRWWTGGKRSGLLVLAILPLLYFASSADVYRRNYHRYGSFMPMPEDMENSRVAWSIHNVAAIPAAVGKIAYAGTVDVARLPLLALQRHTGWDGLEALSFSGSVPLVRDWFITSHSSIGVMFLPVLAMGIVTVLSRDEKLKPYRLQAGIALAYAGILLATVSVPIGNSRYLLPTYGLLLAPSAVVLGRWLDGRLGRGLAAALAVYVSATTVLFSNDRVPPLPMRSPRPTYLDCLGDRGQLMLLGLPGYIPFYDQFQRLVPREASLLVVDNMIQADIDAAEIPHFYPFLVERDPANTQIVHLRRERLGETASFDFILQYTRRGSRPALGGHELVAESEWPAMELYEHRR